MRLSCNVNPIVPCGSVMTTAGVVAGFPARLVATAVVGQSWQAKVPLPRWYWIGLRSGPWLVAFAHWLIFRKLTKCIGALRPYCMVVWAVIATLLAGRVHRFRSDVENRKPGARRGTAVYQWRWSLATLWSTTVFR